MSGRKCRMRSIFSCGSRRSLVATESITIAPAPSAARAADSAVIFFTTPATIICSPPPADDVDTYRSVPVIASPASSRNCLPRSSWISRTALSTPRVTSSTGASTVVGASPRQVSRYSPLSFFSIRIALVVVDPQSVAMTDLIDAGSIDFMRPATYQFPGLRCAWRVLMIRGLILTCALCIPALAMAQPAPPPQPEPQPQTPIKDSDLATAQQEADRPWAKGISPEEQKAAL